MEHCIKLLEHHTNFSQNQKIKVLPGNNKQSFIGIYRIYLFRFSVILQFFKLPIQMCNRTALLAVLTWLFNKIRLVQSCYLSLVHSNYFFYVVQFCQIWQKLKKYKTLTKVDRAEFVFLLTLQVNVSLELIKEKPNSQEVYENLAVCP